MRRFLATLLTAATLLLMVTPSQAASWEEKRYTVKNRWRFEECRYQTTDGHLGWSDDEVRLTIWCFSRHYEVPGGVEKAFCYARHESGFNEFAQNPVSSASGIYQVVDGTWSGWFGRFDTVKKKWELKSSVKTNPRTMAAIALKAARAYNWHPWSDWAYYSC